MVLLLPALILSCHSSSLCHLLVILTDGYAWECQTQEGGWGLDGIIRDNSWKLRGIVNGMDYKEWSPATDVHLQSDGYCNYDVDSLDKKSQNKVCGQIAQAVCTQQHIAHCCYL